MSDFEKTLEGLGIEDDNKIMILDAVKDKNEKDNENNQNLTQNNETDKSQDKITIDFYVNCKENVSNPIDLGNRQFNKNQTLKEILIDCYFGGKEDKLKLKNQAKSSNLTFYCNSCDSNVCVPEKYTGIMEEDLDKTLEPYLGENKLACKSFAVYYFDPDVRNIPRIEGVNSPRKNKNKYLLIIIGIILTIIGIFLLKFFAPEIALIFIIAGIVVVAVGFFWRGLPCCSGRDDLNLTKTESSNGRDLSKNKNMEGDRFPHSDTDFSKDK